MSAQVTPAQAAALLLRRRRARESLMGYVESIDVPGDPANGEEEGDNTVFLPVGSDMAIHHRLLCEELQRCMTTRYGRLMVFMPPGAAKSTYCSVVAPTWFMGGNPAAKIILAMHNGDIAKKQGRKARSVVRQPAYAEIFQTGLSKETTAAEMWIMQNGAEYMAAGITSGIAGNRANGMIIDDPIRGRRDADSPAIRQAVISAYEDDLVTRMMPGGWMVLVQTRWHEADLAGALLPDKYDGRSGDVICKDGLTWRVLNIPAEAVREDDPLGRPKGGMLWPEWFDARHWIAPRKNPRTWSALYQQNPVPDSGGQFERSWFKWYEPHEKPKYLNRFVASDYAVTEAEDAADPDFTEHGCGGVDNDGNLWLLDWWYGQHAPDITIDALLNMAIRNNVTRGFGEVGIIRRAIEPAFKRRIKEFQKLGKLKRGLAIEYLPHIGDKTAKLQSFRSLANSGQVYLPVGAPWAERLVDQLCGFPAVAHDDGVDVCSLFGRALDEMAYAQLPAAEKPDTSLKPYSIKWLFHGTEDRGPPKPKVM